jgi:hypothetical protein
LAVDAALLPDICPFGEFFGIAFRHGESSIGAVTDAKQRPGFPVDPPWADVCNYIASSKNAGKLRGLFFHASLVARCFIGNQL